MPQISKLDDLEFSGDRTLLERPRRAILISRTPRRPTPNTFWVRACVEAAQAAAASGEVLVTGNVREPFHVILAVCRKAGCDAIVALSKSPSEERARICYDLLPERHLLVWPKVKTPRNGGDDQALPLSDRLIGELSDRAYAIQIRKGGNMAAVSGMIRARGGEVDGRFTVKAPRGMAGKNPSPDLARLMRKPLDRAWPYLIHYTREPDGAWPDEPPSAYADWLAFGPREARRDAFDALRRILSMREIIASGRLMPGSTPMVSFTARRPWDLSEIIQWRRGLRRWTVRPYGLAIRRESLERAGARPVAYAAKDGLTKLPSEERLFAQSGEWSREAEWRMRGACLLSGFPPEALCAIVPSAEEARILSREFGVEGQAILE